MQGTINIELLERYLDGKLPREEMYTIERAAMDDPFLNDALEGLSTTAERKAHYSLLQQRLQKRLAQSAGDKRRFNKVTWPRLAIGSAAAVICVLGLILFSIKRLAPVKPKHREVMVELQPGDAAPAAEGTMADEMGTVKPGGGNGSAGADLPQVAVRRPRAKVVPEAAAPPLNDAGSYTADAPMAEVMAAKQPADSMPAVRAARGVMPPRIAAGMAKSQAVPGVNITALKALNGDVINDKNSAVPAEGWDAFFRLLAAYGDKYPREMFFSINEAGAVYNVRYNEGTDKALQDAFTKVVKATVWHYVPGGNNNIRLRF